MSEFKKLITVATNLEACSKKSCKQFDALKSNVRSERQSKIKAIEGLLLKDFKEWQNQQKVISEEMHTKLHDSYKCIVKKCEKELRELIKVDIKMRESGIKTLQDIMSKKDTDTKRKLELQKTINTGKDEIQKMKKILQAKTIDIQKVKNDLQHF
jgi:hypothetical protein